MKVFIAAVLVFVAVSSVQALTDEQKAKLQGLYKKCTAETSVDTALIMKARDKQFTEDPKLMEYYHCMFKNLGFQNDDGSLNVEVIVAKLPVEKKDGLKALVEKCAEGAKGNTATVTAYKAYKCFVEQSNEKISFN